ncbi:hypothetical protein ACHAXT_006332 [Thalassiosira profunda]
MSAESSTQEALHSYLEEKKLNALFVSIVEAILVEKPDSPIGFMVGFLCKKFPEQTKDVIAKQEKPPSLVVAKNDDCEKMSDSSDCTSINTNESVAPEETSSSAKPPQRKKRRESVCAEKIADSVVEESALKVISKTDTEAARIQDILKSNVFFRHLDQNQRKTLQDVMFLREANDGDVIIAQGDDGDNFYILDQGTVEVFIESSDGEKKLVKTCEAGDSFGELAIMYNAPRAASCVAKGDVRLWALDRVSFNVVLVRTTKAKRKAMTDVLLKIPVFSQLTEYELMTIADTLQEETFEDKAVVCSQGDRGDHFFLVQEGTAVCTISQEDGTSVEVARLSSGSYFGEIALLTTKPRQATVTADGTLKCFTLNRQTFNRVMGPLQSILMRNMEEYQRFSARHV